MSLILSEDSNPGTATWADETSLFPGNTFALEFTVPATPGDSVTQIMPKDGTWFMATALATTGAVDTGVIVYNDTKSASAAIEFNWPTSNTTEFAGSPESPTLTAVTREWDAGDSIRLLYDEGLNLTGSVYILFVPR